MSRIILIPGLEPAGPPVGEWGLCNDPWQDFMTTFSATSSISTVEHGVVVDSSFNYDRLIEAGTRLQDRLVKMCEAAEAAEAGFPDAIQYFRVVAYT